VIPRAHRIGIALLALVASAVASADAPTARDAWARATPPGSDVAAVYLTLTGGPSGDQLTGASTDRAAMAHLHSMQESGGMARMRGIDGVEVPAGRTVALAPNGRHLMLMGLKDPLVAGERFTLTLHFASGSERVVEVHVQAPTAPPPTPARP